MNTLGKISNNDNMIQIVRDELSGVLFKNLKLYEIFKFPVCPD